VDLLSGLGDDAPEEQHILTFRSDGRAHVSSVDIAEVLSNLGHPMQEVELWKMAAANAGSDVELAEFLAVLVGKLDGDGNPLDRQKLEVAFDSLDVEMKGCLGKEELKRGTLNLKTTLARCGLEDMCIELTDDEVVEMISKADTTCDGTVSYEEFVKVIQTVAPAID